MNPYAPPGDPAATPAPRTKKKRQKLGDYHAHLDGDVLVVGRDARLPSVCMKCGSHQDIVHRMTKFQWTPRWARFLVFCLIGLIAILLTTKRAELAIPLCAPCSVRWTAARNAMIAGTVAIVLCLVALRLVEDPDRIYPVLAVVVVTFIYMARTYARPRMLQVRKIDDRFVELKGLHEGAAQEIAEGSS